MSWILTFTGKRFDLLHPDAGAVDIRDIAHALAHTCRFAGHTQRFYSVAQHSVLVSETVPFEHALAGLLHDATEAYIHDITSPLKQHLSNYRAIEDGIWFAIRKRFGLPALLPSEVKDADLRLLGTEKRDLLAKHPDPWPLLEGVEPLLPIIKPWGPEWSETMFLARFDGLTKEAA